MNNYYAGYNPNNYNPNNYVRPYIQPQMPPQIPPIENQNGMMNLSNCNFIKVAGPKSVDEYVVDGGYTIYFLDNNKPIMYVKKASEFGPTTTKYYKIEEIDINELNRIVNENPIQTNINSVSDTSNISLEEFNMIKKELDDCKLTINEFKNMLNNNCSDIQNLKDMVSKTNMRDRRDSYESTARRSKSKNTYKQSDEQYVKYDTEQSEPNGNDENDGS